MVGALVGANPKFTAEDVSAREIDQILAALELAQHVRRAILVIPLFTSTDYAKRITELEGHVLFLAPTGTWSFVPDSFWKDGTVRKHLGHNQHPVAVVVFQCSQYHSERADGWDERPLVRTLEAWWAARARGNEATMVRENEARKHKAGQHGNGGMTRSDSGKQGGDGEETPEGATGRGEGAVSWTRR